MFWGTEFLGHLGVRTRKHRCMMGGEWVWSRLSPAEEQGLFSRCYVSGMAGRLEALEWVEVWEETPRVL